MSKLLKSTLPVLLALSQAGVANMVSPTTVQAQARPVIPTPFTQCVRNPLGTGIVAVVSWWDPSVLRYTPPNPRGDDPNTKDIDESVGQIVPDPFARPVRSDSIAVGGSSCIAGMEPTQRRYLATVAVGGSQIVNDVISISMATAIGAVGAAVCVASAGTTCGAVAGATVAVATGAVSLGQLGIPEAKSIFYAGTPGILNVSGTAWAPVWEDTQLGLTSQPWTTRVDFCLTGATDTATANNVSVEFLNAAGAVIGRQTRPGTTSSCGVARDGFIDFAMTTPEAVRSVRVETDGGDAMLIDEVKVWRGNTLVFWDGRPDGRGWCLSKDPNDFQGGWENFAGRCSDSISFSNPA